LITLRALHFWQVQAGYWAVDVASLPALVAHCTTILSQPIQIDVQLAEEVVGRLTGKALDDHVLQSRLLLFDAQMDFVDATIGEHNVVNSRYTRLQTSH
jgi:hypothetical protein